MVVGGNLLELYTAIVHLLSCLAAVRTSKLVCWLTEWLQDSELTTCLTFFFLC